MVTHRITALLLLLTLVFSLFACKDDTPDYVEKDNQDTSNNTDSEGETNTVFVYSTNAKTLHKENCYHVSSLDELFTKTYDGDPVELMDKGFSFCGLCCPEESKLYNQKDEDDNEIFDNGVSRDDASYVINVSTGKFHELDCRYAEESESGNRIYTTSSYDELVMNGLSPCKSCNP